MVMYHPKPKPVRACSRSSLDATEPEDDIEWKRKAVATFNTGLGAAELEAAKELPSRRIILLQRDRRTRAFHKVWLLMMGNEVVCAKDPEEVVAMLHRVQAHNMICDIVFTDGLDHPTLASNINAISRLTRVVQVVSPDVFDREDFFEDSFRNHIDGVLRHNDSVRQLNRVLTFAGLAFDRAYQQEYESQMKKQMETQQEEQACVGRIGKGMSDQIACYDFPMAGDTCPMDDYSSQATQATAAVA